MTVQLFSLFASIALIFVIFDRGCWILIHVISVSGTLHEGLDSFGAMATWPDFDDICDPS